MHPAARKRLDEYATHLLAAAFGPTPRKRYEAGLHESGQSRERPFVNVSTTLRVSNDNLWPGAGAGVIGVLRGCRRATLLQAGARDGEYKNPKPEAASEQSDLLPDCSSLT